MIKINVLMLERNNTSREHDLHVANNAAVIMYLYI